MSESTTQPKKSNANPPKQPALGSAQAKSTPLLPRPIREPASSTPTLSPEDRAISEVDDQWPINTDGRGCRSPEWLGSLPESHPARILVIGDSLTRESQPELAEELLGNGWVPTVRCWGGKGSEWGVEQVERARELGQLPDTIVVALGTNDIWWLGVSMETAVDRIMKALGPTRKVYWVNLHFGPNSYGLVPPTKPNNILANKVGEYPNLIVIDFATQYIAGLEEEPGVGWGDGVHLNSAGYRLRNKIIVDAIGPPSG